MCHTSLFGFGLKGSIKKEHAMFHVQMLMLSFSHGSKDIYSDEHMRTPWN